jgi:hypothetical protein
VFVSHLAVAAPASIAMMGSALALMQISGRVIDDANP